MDWLPEPEPGTPICLGFDGSDVSDFSALRAETRDGFQFTPRYGPNDAPTIWNPAEHGGRVPRSEVSTAISAVFQRFKVARFYYDPPRWETDGENWAAEHGEDRVVQWETYRVKAMHEALERFVVDLTEGRMKHDGCPITAIHMGNARMIPKPGMRYLLGKPSPSQKIDADMASVLAHEAAADARADGWSIEPVDTRVIVFR